MDVGSARQIKRLRGAIKASRQNLEPFRKNRLETLQQYVGKHYGEGGTEYEVPMNVLALAVMIYARNMFPRNPQVIVDTPYDPLKWRSANFELALNHLLKKIQFKRQMDLCIVNAMFGMGVLKVGLTAEGGTDIDGAIFDNGQPYCQAVDLDDWVHDTCAKHWNDIAFAGNRYRVPLDYAKSLDIFNPELRAKLTATHKGYRDADGEERVEWLGQGDRKYDEDEYQDYVELWDVWLPREKLVCTLAAEGEDVPLATVEWQGPEYGPYHIQSFIDVPNNIMPVAPCAHWLDLHNLINSLMRKLSNQAQREKQILHVPGGTEDDAKRITNANDGEAILTTGAGKCQEARYGGPDQPTMLFMLQAKDQASWIAGNLDSLGGLSPMADTLGAERLLAQNASRQMAEMQDRTILFSGDVCKALGWWVWTDRITDIPLARQLPSGEVLNTHFTPEDRTGDFLDYNITINPYSLQDQSPAEKLQTLRGFVQQDVVPLLPVMQSQGFTINLEQYFRAIARYTHMDEFDRLLTFMRQPQPTQPGPIVPGVNEMQPHKPPVTKRIEERISRPGSGRSMKDSLMGNLLSGSALQPKEAAGLSMPTV